MTFDLLPLLEPSDADCNATFDETIAERAKNTSLAIPTPITVLDRLLAALRERERSTNLDLREHEWRGWWFTHPAILVCDADFDNLYTVPWDHSEEQLCEAVENARRCGGVVFVDVHVGMLAGNGAPILADEAISVEVWPRFRVRYPHVPGLTAPGADDAG